MESLDVFISRYKPEVNCWLIWIRHLNSTFLNIYFKDYSRDNIIFKIAYRIGITGILTDTLTAQ